MSTKRQIARKARTAVEGDMEIDLLSSRSPDRRFLLRETEKQTRPGVLNDTFFRYSIRSRCRLRARNIDRWREDCSYIFIKQNLVIIMTGNNRRFPNRMVVTLCYPCIFHNITSHRAGPTEKRHWLRYPMWRFSQSLERQQFPI